MSIPNLVHSENLSLAWAKTFLLALNSPKNAFSSTLVSVDIKAPKVEECPKIVNLLTSSYNYLNSQPKYFRKSGRKFISISDNASLIFPQSLWRPVSKNGYDNFFEIYTEKVYPKLKKVDTRNKYGTYFLRMIPQLKIILDYWKEEQTRNKRVRRSALQASCIEPEKDLEFFMVPVFEYEKDLTKTPMRGFPCLQQVSFCWNDANELSVSAYYPTQYVFDRGYGNYLGLCNLGSFMATEMGLKFTKLNCFINALELGDPNKGEMKVLQRGLSEIGVTLERGDGSWKTV